MLLLTESIFGPKGVIGCRSKPTLIGISETTDAIQRTAGGVHGLLHHLRRYLRHFAYGGCHFQRTFNGFSI